MTGAELRAKLTAWAEEQEVTIGFYDGFDDAIMGLAQQFNTYMVLYDRDKIIAKLTEEMDEESAWEYYEFNIIGGYHGENTPAMFHVPDEL
jgi:hypothetical protein